MVFVPDLLRVVPPDGNLMGLFVGETELRCEVYDDGTFVAGATRGSISYSGETTIEDAITLIAEDSEALVGPGSFVFKVGASVPATQIVVWDVIGGAIYTRDLTAGHRCTTPVYVGGYLYWFEWQSAFESPVDISFQRARADLSDREELETFTLPEINGNVGGGTARLVIPTSSGIVFSWRTGNEDGHSQMRFYAKEFVPGAAVNVTTTWGNHYGLRPNEDDPTWLDGLAVAAAMFDGPLSYVTANVSTQHDDGFVGGARGRLQTLTGTGSTPGALWVNNDGDWDLLGSASVDVAGDFAAVYGGVDAPKLIRHDRSIPIEAGAPIFSDSVDFHPEMGIAPAAMFFRIL